FRRRISRLALQLKSGTKSHSHRICPTYGLAFWRSDFSRSQVIEIMVTKSLNGTYFGLRVRYVV
ncbi:hypothetical protein, partial [Rhizobium leguminosarum]|uniref:hypothetical protein n=1 Tax=Rhizobium leguminosarum TaxID=384 RepID=UPI00197EB229